MLMLQLGEGRETNLQLRERRFSLSQLISVQFKQLLQLFRVLGKSKGVATNVQVVVVTALVSGLAAVALGQFIVVTNALAHHKSLISCATPSENT